VCDVTVVKARTPTDGKSNDLRQFISCQEIRAGVSQLCSYAFEKAQGYQEVIIRN
jgi:hypothetical protein